MQRVPRTFGYNAQTLQLETETVVAGTGALYTKTISRAHEPGAPNGEIPGRVIGFSIGTEYTVSYGYDATGRFNAVSGPGLYGDGVAYGRVANGDKVALVEFYEESNNVVASVARAYGSDATPADRRDVLRSVENRNETSGTPQVSLYTYVYDAVGRRESVANTGSAFPKDNPTDPAGFFSLWRYNERSELTGAWRGRGTTVPSRPPPTNDKTGERRAYAYDPIGNRQTHTDAAGETVYKTTNRLNQYEEITRPSADESVGHDADGNLIGDGLVAADFDHDGDVDLGDSTISTRASTGRTGRRSGGTARRPTRTTTTTWT